MARDLYCQGYYNSTTIDVCKKNFTTFSIQKYLVSDNAKTFTSVEFTTFLKVNGITQKLTVPYAIFRRSNASNVHVMLQQILIQYQNTSRPVTGKSPVLMFAKKLRTRSDLLLPTKNERIENKQAPIIFQAGKE